MDDELDEAMAERNDRRLSTMSTGSRRSHGRKQSRHNAIRHGIFADIVLTGEPFRESVEDYERLHAELRKGIRPRSPLQEMLIEALAFEFLRMSRVYKADAQVAPRIFKRVEEELTNKDSEVVVEIVDREREIALIRKQLDPELLLRYGNSISKQIHRILDRLERLQAFGPARLG
jgi:hypothetical protein